MINCITFITLCFLTSAKGQITVEECKQCLEKPYAYKVPNLEDCLGYYICLNYTVIQQQCTAGFKFDETLQTCIPGTCPPCTNPSPTTFSTKVITASTDATIQTDTVPNTTAQPTEVTSTTKTPSADTTVRTMPSTSTTNTDFTLQTTLPSPTDHCSNPPQCTRNMHGQIIPDANDCRIFWQCVQDIAFCRFCEIGKWFDREAMVCNYQELVVNCFIPNEDF